MERLHGLQCSKRTQKKGKEVDDRASAEHADDRADPDVGAINEKQDQDDQKTNTDMYCPVCDLCTADQAMQPLNQDIEGVCSKISQQEECNTEMRDCQSYNENYNSEEDFFT